MKKADKIILDLHVLIEEKVNGFRAHCLEFDLALSAKDEKQAKDRMEELIDKHINYGAIHHSNPVHMASEEICQKWFSPNAQEPLKKSYILSLDFGKPSQRQSKGRSNLQYRSRIVERRSRENIHQLVAS